MASPIYKPDTDLVVDAAGSSITLGEKIGRTQIERGKLEMMKRRLYLFPRGSWGTGDYTGFRVLQAQVVHEKGDVGVLTVQWEVNPDFGGSSSLVFLPPDDFEIVDFEINPPLAQHPNFSAIDAQYRGLVKEATEGADQQVRDWARVRIGAAASSSVAAAVAALALIGEMDKGTQTYYLTGEDYNWWSFFWTYPPRLPGGNIETPGGPGASKIQSSFSWLRLTDRVTAENGYWKLTRRWKGAPNGHWSTAIYS